MKKYIPALISIVLLLSMLFIGSALSAPERTTLHLTCEDCHFEPNERSVCVNALH